SRPSTCPPPTEGSSCWACWAGRSTRCSWSSSGGSCAGTVSFPEEAMSSGASLECRDLVKSFPTPAGERRVIEHLSMRVEPGEFAVILGPSGCGKTTLLRTLSGLLPVDHGEVRVDGHVVRDVPDDVAVVFQEYNKSLFPWLTLERNVRFALRGLGKAQARERARAALRRVGLAESAQQYPWQVSGGMQQRAAIARALACHANLVIMDEPFASVDALTRIHLELMLLDIWTESRFTVVFVTHDIEEAPCWPTGYSSCPAARRG